jgi:hypothetical protein
LVKWEWGENVTAERIRIWGNKMTWVEGKERKERKKMGGRGGVSGGVSDGNKDPICSFSVQEKFVGYSDFQVQQGYG